VQILKKPKRKNEIDDLPPLGLQSRDIGAMQLSDMVKIIAQGICDLIC